MRIATMILSILCMLGGAGLGILSTDQGFGDNAAKYEKTYETAKKALGEDNELTKKAG